LSRLLRSAYQSSARDSLFENDNKSSTAYRLSKRRKGITGKMLNTQNGA
jgi:hypothetical protein